MSEVLEIHGYDPVADRYDFHAASLSHLRISTLVSSRYSKAR